jgi:hypothetical protein
VGRGTVPEPTVISDIDPGAFVAAREGLSASDKLLARLAYLLDQVLVENVGDDPILLPVVLRMLGATRSADLLEPALLRLVEASE